MYFDSDWFIFGDFYYSIIESLRGDRGVDQKLEPNVSFYSYTTFI